jgi:DNA-directed RNA polymerase subunit RPC12/RpoP
VDALDGNAIAGPLHEHFGSEMTLAVGVCGHCGASSAIAELVVYSRAPGAVVRCRHCGNVVIVLLRSPDRPRVELSAFTLMGGPAHPQPAG